ncbi:MAG: helix-turn-helix transcriptional regulator [Treponema sp.]|jgi:AraC-like DNA-binding protein|nr:helix-turn-helix transcriptional regulator [Treponema sp.]
MAAPAFKNQTPRYGWFIYYLVILSVPMLLSVLIYFHSRQIINRNSGEIYAASLEQARIESDGIIDAITRALEQISVNRNVQKLTFITGKPSPDDVLAMYNLMAELKNYQILSPVIDDVFLVLNRIDTIVGAIGSIYQEWYYDLYYGDDGLREMKKLMKEPHRMDVLPVNDRFLFLRTTPENNLSESSITIAIAVNRERFLEKFGSVGENPDSATYIFDEHKRIVCSSVNAPDLPPDFNAEKGNIKLGKTLYYPLAAGSRMTNWKYVCLIPMDVQGQRARQIQYSTLAALLGCSLFSIFFSFRMTRRSYNTQLALWNDLQVLRNYYIYTLLEKPYDPENGPGEMEKYSIELPGENNIVLLFAVSEEFSGGEWGEPGKALSEKEGNKINLIRFALISAFQKSAGRRFRVEMTDVGKNTAAIVNWSGDRDGTINLLEDDIEYTQRRIEEQFHASVSTALGEWRRGLEGIYYSNMEARETLQYLDAKNGQTILHYRDIRNQDTHYQFPQEMEQKLINMILLGDGEAACGLVRRLFEMNTSKDGPSGPVLRILAADILGSVMKGTSAGEGRPAEWDLLNPEQIPARDLAASLEKTIREICAANRIILEKKSSPRISEKVKEYIGGNFRNPDINISITGLHFNMSPFYLSRIFKEETGMGLLEYINALRIGEGKKLLARGQSIVKTAEMTGFRNSNAFIRVFKKLTGVTPGQYKGIE